MSALSPRAAARTAAAVAMAAGMAVCLSAGTASASPAGGVPDRLGSGKDRVILQAPASAAAASSLSLSADAPRLVGGAGARVTAKYSCPTGSQGFLEVGLTEVTGNVVARGYGSNTKPLTCDGKNRNLNISVVVANDYPFKKGKALAQGFLYAFNDAGQESSAATERTITIT